MQYELEDYRQYTCAKCGNKVIVKVEVPANSILCGNGCMNRMEPPGPVVMYWSNIPTIELIPQEGK